MKSASNSNAAPTGSSATRDSSTGAAKASPPVSSPGSKKQGKKRDATEAGLPDKDKSDLNDMLECPVCFEDMCAPIYQCPAGHLLCSSCKAKLSACPACKAGLTDIRNRALEKLAETLTGACAFGCGEVLKRPEKKEHEEKKCSLRPFSCPTVGSDCDFTGTAVEIAQHMVQKHEAKRFDSDRIDMTITNTQQRSGYLVWQRIHYCHGIYVLLVVERHEYSNTAKERYVAYCRVLHNERLVCYRISISRTPRRLTWEGPARSIREAKEVMRDSNDCLVIEPSMALFFSGSQGADAKLQLRFQGKIFKREQGQDSHSQSTMPDLEDSTDADAMPHA